MRRLVLAFALTLGILVLTPTPSWACSCAMTTTPQHVKDAVTVAAGTVDWTATNGQTRTYQVHLDSVYKGAAAGSEKLVTTANAASCGLGSLATGQRYLFFIDGRHPGTMRVGLCGGTTAYDDALAAQVAAVTGPPGKPLPSPGQASDAAADGTGRTVLLGAGAAALLVLVVAGALVARRGRSAGS